MPVMIIDRSKQALQICSVHNASLCLATKNQSPENIAQANVSPKIILAENRIQEAEEKFEYYKSVCNPLHFIGSLQKNKVRKAVRLFDCIQTVDSIDLMRRIDRIAAEEEKIIEIFINVNISQDPQKSGFLLDDVVSILEDIKNSPLQSTKITGLFTILQNNLSPQQIEGFYATMKKLFDVLGKNFGPSFTNLSMGMSNDFDIALQKGATIVRVGSAVFNQ